MSNRRFEMHEIRQIIFRFRQGDSIRGIARAELADRKKIRKVRKTAVQQDWLNTKKELPSDEELSKFFRQSKIYFKFTLVYQALQRCSAWWFCFDLTIKYRDKLTIK